MRPAVAERGVNPPDRRPAAFAVLTAGCSDIGDGSMNTAATCTSGGSMAAVLHQGSAMVLLAAIALVSLIAW